MPLTQSSPRIHYEVHGEQGTPVVMVMGFGMRGLVWRPQLGPLRQRHRVITFDHRGVGGSQAVRGLLTIREMAGDVLRVADELSLADFHLVGVSMGGMIAQEVAIAARDRLRSMTLIVTHAGGGQAWIPPRDALRLFVEANVRRDRERRVEALMSLLYPSDYRRAADPDALRARMREQLGTPAPGWTALAHLSAIMRHDTAERLAGIDVPTLLIKASRDILIRPEETDRLLALLARARLVEYEAAGHGVTFQEAQAINKELLAHFAAHE